MTAMAHPTGRKAAGTITIVTTEVTKAVHTTTVTDAGTITTTVLAVSSRRREDSTDPPR